MSQGQGAYQAQVVEYLCELKLRGHSYEHAWSEAMRRYPSRRMGDTAVPSLFDDESVMDAFERYCSDAWHGRKPKLAEFSLELLFGDGDDSRPAGRAGHIRQAA